MKNFRRTLTFGLGAALCVGTAFGGTITQTFTVPSSATEITDSESNSAFWYYGHYAPAGQQLTGVTLEFSGDEQLVSLSVTNNTTAQQFYTVGVSGDLLVNSIANENSNGAGQLDDSAALNALQNSGGGFSGTIWSIGSNPTPNAVGVPPYCYMGIAGNSTQTWYTGSAPSGSAPALAGAGNTSHLGAGSPCTPVEGSGTLATDSMQIAGILADYSSGNQFNLSFDTATGASGSNSNIQSGVSDATVAFGTFQVIYTYVPSGTPEPSTMLLLGSGLVGFGLLRRRVVKR